MIKRLIKVLLFIPVALVLMTIQIPYEVVRWIITGKEFNDPWILKLIYI